MEMRKDTWTCDYCGEEIASIKDGWVERLRAVNPDGSKRERGFRLVHHKTARDRSGSIGCQYIERNEWLIDGSFLVDGPLGNFLGADGLMRLLSLVNKREHPLEDILELIKRLHIPGYEHARNHLGEAIVISDGYYTQAEIKNALDEIE